jgi:hypothetical protein
MASFYLGGEMEDVLPGRHVRVRGYGGGIFKYVTILPYEEGAEKLRRFVGVWVRFMEKQAVLVRALLEDADGVLLGVGKS